MDRHLVARSAGRYAVTWSASSCWCSARPGPPGRDLLAGRSHPPVAVHAAILRARPRRGDQGGPGRGPPQECCDRSTRLRLVHRFRGFAQPGRPRHGAAGAGDPRPVAGEAGRRARRARRRLRLRPHRLGAQPPVPTGGRPRAGRASPCQTAVESAAAEQARQPSSTATGASRSSPTSPPSTSWSSTTSTSTCPTTSWRSQRHPRRSVREWSSSCWCRTRPGRSRPTTGCRSCHGCRCAGRTATCAGPDAARATRRVVRADLPIAAARRLGLQPDLTAHFVLPHDPSATMAGTPAALPVGDGGTHGAGRRCGRSPRRCSSCS